MNTQVPPPQSSQGNGAWPLGSCHLHDKEQSYIVELVGWLAFISRQKEKKNSLLLDDPVGSRYMVSHLAEEGCQKRGIRLKKRSLPSLGTVWPFGWRITNGSTHDSMSFSPCTFRKSLSPASRKFKNVFRLSVVLRRLLTTGSPI